MRSSSKTLLLATVILMDILAGAELDLFVPSFPELQTLFELSPFWVETLLSLNLIGFCLSLFFVGGLGDRYGRKPIILLGLGIFTLGSLFCLGATSYPWLVSGRFLQGIGAAAPATLCYLIIADLYPLKQQQYLMAMLSGISNTSIAFAPILGSYISLYFHWQGNFVTLLIFGLIVFGMTLFFIPHRTPSVQEQQQIDIAFSGYIPLFQSKTLMLILTHIVFAAVTYCVFVGISPILYMEDLGVNLAHFGYYQGALALMFAFGCIFSGFIIYKVDQQKLLQWSFPACVLSFMILAWVTWVDTHNPLWITLSLLPFCIFVALPIAILFPIGLNLIPTAKARVSALFQASRLLFMALGLQLAGYYYQNTFQNIGIIITICLFISVLALFFIIRNHDPIGTYNRISQGN